MLHHSGCFFLEEGGLALVRRQQMRTSGATRPQLNSEADLGTMFGILGG
jgi:hypothetical protein